MYIEFQIHGWESLNQLKGLNQKFLIWKPTSNLTQKTLMPDQHKKVSGSNCLLLHHASQKKRQILPVSGPYMAICGFAIRYRLLYEFRLEEKGIPIHVTKTRINWGIFKSCNFSMIITYLQKKMLNILQLHEQFIPKIEAEGYLNLNYYVS